MRLMSAVAGKSVFTSNGDCLCTFFDVYPTQFFEHSEGMGARLVTSTILGIDNQRVCPPS